MGLFKANVVQELIEGINENTTRQDASADLLADADARAQRVKMQMQTYARTKALVI